MWSKVKLKTIRMFVSNLKRMNALTPEQAKILVRIVDNKPVSPKSIDMINKLF